MTHIQHLDALCANLPDNGAAVVFAGSPAINRHFRQDSNFLYLTGLEEPDFILVAIKRRERVYKQMFIARTDPARIVWEGKKPSKEEITAHTGIASVAWLDEFPAIIPGFLAEAETVYVNTGTIALNAPLNKAQLFVEEALKRYPQARFCDLTPLIRPLRVKKDAYEIEMMQKAIDVTAGGLAEVWKALRPGVWEYEMESVLYHHMLSQNVRHWGFLPIVATGINAATLHYDKNNCQTKTGDVFLTDVGAALGGYSADITRTVPVDGRFSDRQRAVYAAVLRIQKAIIDQCRPGASLPELNRLTVEMMQEEMLSLGIISKKEDYFPFYPHSIGHHLGLDTHDVGQRDSTLEAGCVVTVEPGIYLPDEDFGIRIEDDILITETGNTVLSARIPKEVEEIEDLRQKALGK